MPKLKAREWTSTAPSQSKSRRWVAAILGVALAASAAGCRTQSPTQAQTAVPSPLHQGPLTDYVASAGLRWMFVGRPKELAQNPELLTEVNRILSARRLDSFAAASGVELRELPEGCIAGFDYGTIYLARVGGGVPLVRKRFEERLISDAVIRSPHPHLWRITGLVANTPESLLAADNDFVAVAVGDPLLVRVAEAFATGRFKKSKPALSGAALASLPADLSQAPLRFYAPGPFTGEWANAADGVLARALAFGADVTLPSPSVLQVRFVLSGAFGPDLDKTRSRLEETWGKLQTSPIGHVLRLEETLAPASVSVLDDRATLTVSYPVSVILRGISAAVIDNIGQIMGSLPTEGAAPTQPPAQPGLH